MFATSQPLRLPPLPLLLLLLCVATLGASDVHSTLAGAAAAGGRAARWRKGEVIGREGRCRHGGGAAAAMATASHIGAPIERRAHHRMLYARRLPVQAIRAASQKVAMTAPPELLAHDIAFFSLLCRYKSSIEAGRD